MNGPRLTRRAAAVLIAAGAPAFAAAPVSFGGGEDEVRLRLLQQALGRGEGAAQIGAAYLTRFPGERDAGWLLGALTEAGVDAPRYGLRRRHALLASIDQAARRDFTAGQTVRIEGWVMSVTELRAYALVAILAGVA